VPAAAHSRRCLSPPHYSHGGGHPGVRHRQCSICYMYAFQWQLMHLGAISQGGSCGVHAQHASPRSLEVPHRHCRSGSGLQLITRIRGTQIMSEEQPESATIVGLVDQLRPMRARTRSWWSSARSPRPIRVQIPLTTGRRHWHAYNSVHVTSWGPSRIRSR
jgi:hypothetical protein